MKKNYFLASFILALTFLTFSCETDSIDEIELKSTQNKKTDKKEKCTSIQSGGILYAKDHYLTGEPLTTGFDIFGYNYQAHIFKGLYFNLGAGNYGYSPYEGDDEAYLSKYPDVDKHEFLQYYWPYRNDEVNMTWNDAWQPNKDCSGNGFLDVIPISDVVGSGSWENFHSKGTYVNAQGQNCQWEQHTKIIALPENAVLSKGYWYWDDTNGNQIGKDFYGSWAIIQTVFNDPCGEIEDIEEYLSPFRAGFGNR